jgi:hypothetical protein
LFRHTLLPEFWLTNRRLLAFCNIFFQSLPLELDIVPVCYIALPPKIQAKYLAKLDPLHTFLEFYLSFITRGLYAPKNIERVRGWLQTCAKFVRNPSSYQKKPFERFQIPQQIARMATEPLLKSLSENDAAISALLEYRVPVAPQQNAHLMAVLLDFAHWGLSCLPPPDSDHREVLQSSGVMQMKFSNYPPQTVSTSSVQK